MNKGLVYLDKKHPYFKQVRWVCLALTGKNHSVVRPALDCLHVSIDGLTGNVRLTGCDAHRIHRFDESRGLNELGFTDGLYQVDKCTRSEIMLHRDEDTSLVYPDVDRCIPDETLKGEEISLSTSLKDKPFSIRYARVTRLLADSGGTVSIAMLRDLMDFGEGSALFSTRKGGAHTFLCMSGEGASGEGMYGQLCPISIPE